MKKQVVPPELLEEVFELNMQLEEARMNKQMGERDPQLTTGLEETKKSLEDKFGALDNELHGYWNEWDAFVDRQPGVAPEEQRKQIRDKMVSVLNRRTYIRNLVRDVNDVLED